VRHHQQLGIREKSDVGEVLHYVIPLVLSLQRGCDAKIRSAPDNQRVTIRRRDGNHFRSKQAAGARPVVDQDALAKPGEERRADGASNEVRRPARDVGYDQTDGFIGIFRHGGKGKRSRPQRNGEQQ
jgi:hypothetical protein